MADARLPRRQHVRVSSSSSVLGGAARCRATPKAAVQSNGRTQQLQYNRPNLPIFSKGRFPFIGDYIDIAGQSFVATPDGGWAWNTGRTANRPAPVFHVTWADNRNVGTPRNTQLGALHAGRARAQLRSVRARPGRHPQPGRLHRAAAARPRRVGAAQFQAHRRPAALVRRRRAATRPTASTTTCCTRCRRPA